MIFKYKLAIRSYFFVPKKIQNFMENRLEIRMTKIFRDFSPHDGTQQLFIQRLLFSESNHESGAFERSKTLLVVLKCRGLLRTLLYLFPLADNEIPPNLHSLNRMEIFKTLFVKRSLFFNHIIARLKLVYPSPQDLNYSIQINDIIMFNLQKLHLHQGERFLFFNIQNEKGPIFGSDNQIRVPKKEVFFQRLMNWDSQRVAAFILLRQLGDVSKRYLDHVYPQFLGSIAKFESISIKTLPGYDKVLELESITNLQSGYQVLQSVQIWNQRFIISNGELVVIDSTSHPKQEFVAGHWQFIKSFDAEENRCLIRKTTAQTKHMNSAIFLSGRCDENWFHFIIDTVPRVLFVNDIPIEVPLIIRSDIPENSKAILTAITNRELIEIEPDEKIEVQNLYVVPGRSSVFDSEPPKGTFFVEFSPPVLKRLQTLLVNVVIELEQNRGIGSSTEKIALIRSSATRNIQNWLTLQTLIENFGFTVHDLNLDFFKDQIKSFSQAKIIVAPGGAAMANIIFMPEGSTVVVLRSWRNSDLELWVKLAEAMNVNCIEVTGIPTYFGPGKLRRMHSDFYISPRKLRKVLASVTASIT